MTSAEVTQLDPADALARVHQVMNDVKPWLAPHLSGEHLEEKLCNLESTDAVKLLLAWRGMTCRNASLVEFCSILSGCTGSNTAPLLLGAGDTAKGASMYMLKYMVKDAYDLAASLSVLADARKHIQAYPSRADDTGTAARCTRHFLQRVLNASATELAPTQAAAIVLGVRSSGHSHTFVNAYVWDAVHLLEVVQKGGNFIADASEPPRTTWTPQTIQATDDVDAADDTGGAASEEDVDAADDTGHGRTGSCNIYSTASGSSVPLSQAEHYAHRARWFDLRPRGVSNHLVTLGGVGAHRP